MSELWTPAPWEYRHEDGGVEGYCSGSFWHAGEPIIGVSSSDELYVRLEDARLVELAPEMADVLAVFERYTPTMMRVYGNHFPSLSRPLDDAHQLLVRARGETA